MSLKTTTLGRRIFKKAQSLCVIPYVYDTNLKTYVLGQDIYDLSAIIGDSIALEQSEGETTTKENEFTGEPIVSNTKAGKTTFTAQCLDLQNKVMRVLFGASVGYDISEEAQGIVAMPTDLQTLYCLIRIRFQSNDTPDVYLPKVLLNSTLMLEQMKTRGAQGNLSGQLYSSKVCVGSREQSNTLIQFSQNNSTTSNIVDTPILFCPQNYTPFFLHHHDSDLERYVFSQVLWNIDNGASVREVAVNEDNTSIYNLI